MSINHLIPINNKITDLYKQYPEGVSGLILDSVRKDESRPSYAMYLDKIKSILPDQGSLYPDQIFFPGYEYGQMRQHDGQSTVFRDKQEVMYQAMRTQVNKQFKVDAMQRILDVRKQLGLNAEFGTKYLPYIDKVQKRTQKIGIYMISIMMYLAYRLKRQEKYGLSGNTTQDNIYKHVHDALLINMFPHDAYNLTQLKQSPLILAQRTSLAIDNDDLLADIDRAYSTFKMLMNSGFDEDLFSKLPDWYSKITQIVTTPILAIGVGENISQTQLFIDETGKYYQSSDSTAVYQHENAITLGGKLNGSIIYTINTNVDAIKHQLIELENLGSNITSDTLDSYLQNILTAQETIQTKFEILFDRYQELINVLKYASLVQFG